MSDGPIRISAELDQSTLDSLKTLAAQRGVSANTVLQQAIQTEKLLADNVRPEDEVFIRKGNNETSKIVFSTS